VFAEADSELEVRETEIRFKQARLAADFFGWAIWGRSRESRQTVVSSRGELLGEMYESARARLRASVRMNFLADLDASLWGESLVTKQAVFAQTKLDFRKDFATRQDFSAMRRNYLPLAHPDLVVFSDDQVNQHLGTLRLRSRLLFSEPALNDILSADRETSCSKFASQIPVDDPAAWCRRMNQIIDPHRAALRMSSDPQLQVRYRAAIVGTKAFVRDHERARRNYLRWVSQAANSRDRNLQRQLADALSQLMSTTHLPEIRIATLKSFTSPEMLYHFSSLSSSLGGLPGHEYILELNHNARGNASLTEELEQTRNSLQSPVTAVYDASLDPLFFNFLERERILLKIPR
jgi:hypothetical protein